MDAGTQQRREETSRPAAWKVGELAARTGLSVRTLHYYDEVGLLPPSCRTDGGHRLYTAGDVVRLQQIRSLRALGFTLRGLDGPRRISCTGDRTPAREVLATRGV